ncbi:hypothetical protein OIE66_11855 [Nonomuraea sp. NBC_01738]|uniref:hypothetical protein n=1 Tax=Nonomuraea sp. NBC_01738 TaxID=2976003 RepID=UPI002E1219DE|nr:hypothetical protein OIE66_11855 [Nonomuraea sp. NBC_01738]
MKVVADQGVAITIQWQLPRDARKYPVVVQREPADGQQLIPLDPGSTSARLVGLTKDAGYCFLVGVPLQISAKTTVAWSKPLCVRGAKPGKP